MLSPLGKGDSTTERAAPSTFATPNFVGDRLDDIEAEDVDSRMNSCRSSSLLAGAGGK
jgi:hypothetical protein